MLSSVLYTGGSCCGKSRLAQAWAEAHSEPRCFIATAGPDTADAEMTDRIKRHKKARGSKWATTIEEPSDIAASVIEAARSGARTVLVDCITQWLANLGCNTNWEEDRILSAVDQLAKVVANPPCDLAVVTNEVGSGIQPDRTLGRRLRDLQGDVNQRLAAAAHSVALVSCGFPVWLKTAKNALRAGE